ncbi:hypothetical protein A0H81_00454 [Grifola frondosa]|uniref:Protein kinase domain-containing protein n=1 Tax=Grifola frondosa TaxID=5627 RepID=A0A1C7MQJ0_GRIFR|nr:hypothetical protein A0H81_00454 [Grifola frondosa]
MALNPAAPKDGLAEKDKSGELLDTEVFWKKHQRWLEQRGYKLRPRYHEEWISSRHGTDKNCPDALSLTTMPIVDAIRVSDGTYVSLKRVRKSYHPYEAEIIQFFSTEPLASDPQNHCVPTYEILQSTIDDDHIIIVMPWLRAVDDPRFYTVGEGVECVRQICEGVQFMHRHRVAHRDIMNLNIMMDPKPILSEMSNPVIEERSYDLRRSVKIYTRTKHPVRYYLVDFGLSRKYSEDEMPPLEEPIRGGVKTVPEFQDSVNPCNPFPTDIYYLGFFIRETFVQKGPCFKFLQSFVDDMVQKDPAKRPTIDEVVTRTRT